MAVLILPSRNLWKPSLPCQVDWGHPLAQGLVGCYLMNEGGGGFVFDIARNYHGAFGGGTLASYPAWVSGARGTALRFDGIDDHITTNLPLSLLGQRFSVEAIFRPDTTGVHRGLVGQHYLVGAVLHGICVMQFTSPNWQFHYMTGLTSPLWSIPCNVSLVMGRQYHVVCVAQASAFTRVYLDGLLAAHEAQTVAANHGTASLWIGRSFNDPNRFLQGQVTKVSVYNEVLTAEQSAWLHAEPYCFIKPVVRRFYSFPTVAPARQVIFGGTSTEPSTIATEFSSLMGDGYISWAATEAARSALIPTPGKLTNFQAQVAVAPGAGSSWTFTVMRNAVATALSVVIAGTDVLSSVDTDEVVFAAGDRVSIQSVPSGTPTAAGAVYWTCEFIPDISGETILLSNSAGTTLTANIFHILLGGKTPDSIEFDSQTLFPTSGTLAKFFVRLATAPGIANSRTFTVRVNGVSTALAVTISGTDTVGSNTVSNVPIAAGDSVSIQNTISGIPAASAAQFGIVFTPSVSGEFITSASTDDPTDSAVVEFQHLTCGDSLLTTTESEQHNLARATVAKRIQVRLAAAPGGGNTWTFNLRRNLSDTPLSVSITGTALTGNAAVDVPISNGDLLNTRIDATAGISLAKTQIAYLFSTVPPLIELRRRAAFFKFM